MFVCFCFYKYYVSEYVSISFKVLWLSTWLGYVLYTCPVVSDQYLQKVYRLCIGYLPGSFILVFTEDVTTICEYADNMIIYL